MKLIVNGEAREYGGDSALAVFLKAEGVDPVRVAVMVNDEIVRQHERESRMLRDGDRLEILVFAGGG